MASGSISHSSSKVVPEPEQQTDREESLDRGKGFDAEDLNNTCNRELPGSDNFDGPVSSRKCTDTCYLALFVVSNVFLILLLWYVYIAGDFERLLHWADFRGELCGVGDLSGKEYTYWPEPEVSTDLAMCAEGCPGNVAMNGICLYETDHETDTTICYDSYPSKPFAKLCIPADEDLREDITDLLFNDVGQVTRRVAGDILKAWDVILIGLFISFSFALIFLIFFRFPGTMKIVVAVFSFIGVFCLAALAILTFYEEGRVYDLINDDQDDVDMNRTDDNVNSRAYFNLGVAIAVIGIIIFIAIIFLLLSVRDTFAILRLAARPLKNIPMLLLVPIAQIALGSVIFILMLSSSMATISLGEVDRIEYEGTIPGDHVKILHYHEQTRWILLFTIPVCLWWLSAIASSGEYLVSSASAVWFFSKEKRVLESPIWKGVQNMFQYHLGSVLLGSIIVPLFRVPKAVLGWICGKIGNDGCCASCCCGLRKVYNGFVRYLSDDAYAFQAIWGDGFARSARRAYFLKSRSKHNLKSLATAGDFSVWIFSIVVTLAAPTFVMYWVIFEKKTFSNLLTEEITSAVAPAVIALLAGAFMAQVFSSIFRACIHSAIVCFLADHEMFVEMQGFVDEDMKDYFSKRGVKTVGTTETPKNKGDQVSSIPEDELPPQKVVPVEDDEPSKQDLEKSLENEFHEVAINKEDD